MLSQVVLSLQLSFAVIPLITFTSDREKMGEFANPPWVIALAVLTAVIIVGLNANLVVAAGRRLVRGAAADAVLAVGSSWCRVVAALAAAARSTSPSRRCCVALSPARLRARAGARGGAGARGVAAARAAGPVRRALAPSADALPAHRGGARAGPRRRRGARARARACAPARRRRARAAARRRERRRPLPRTRDLGPREPREDQATLEAHRRASSARAGSRPSVRLGYGDAADRAGAPGQRGRAPTCSSPARTATACSGPGPRRDRVRPSATGCAARC